MVLKVSPEAAAGRYLQQHLEQAGSPFEALVSYLCSTEVVVEDCQQRQSPRAVEGPPEPPPETLAETRSTTFLGRLRRRWLRYRVLLGEEVSAVRAVLCLPGFLMGKWQLQHVREILPRLWPAVRYQWRQRGSRE
jgi:hypothetical protein